jgi:hypothetical protein
VRVEVRANGRPDDLHSRFRPLSAATR